MQQKAVQRKNFSRHLFEPDALVKKSASDLHRYQHFTIFVLLGIPTMLVFALFHLLQADYLLFLVILASSLALVGGWMQVRKAHHSAPIYRLNGLIYCGLMLYLVTLGGAEGSKALWMYSVPLISIFLYGKYEGLTWSLAMLLLAGGLTSAASPLNSYAYAADFKLRFALSFLIVTFVSYWFEHQRQGYRHRLEEQNRQLQLEQERLKKTMAEVAKLRELIPMCANCRKLRDDEGYWKDIERYLEDHAKVQFTHGLCPDCIKELYPGVVPKSGL